jgi:homoserine O-succinyltransferase
MTRKTKIGLVNIMPNALQYERLIKDAIKDLEEVVEIYPIRLAAHNYTSSSEVESAYETFDALIQRIELDLLIVTGAPVEDLDYEDIYYWDELIKIIRYAEKSFKSTLGICFGALALAKYLGIDKQVSPRKFYGCYRFQRCSADNRYLAGEHADFHMPVSTWARLDDNDVKSKLGNRVHALAHHPDLGYGLLETNDRKFLMLLGHPEYTIDTLRAEWLRDSGQGYGYTRNFSERDFDEMHRIYAPGRLPLISRWIAAHSEFAEDLLTLFN